MTDFTPAARPFTGRKATLVVVAFFGVIIAVNAVMLMLAVNSFGGLVVGNSYVASQNFNADIATARAQPIRGWSLDLKAADGALVLTIRDRDGAALRDLSPTLTLARPTHGRETLVLPLRETGAGVYGGAASPAPGRWIATVEMRDGQTRSLTFDHGGAGS